MIAATLLFLTSKAFITGLCVAVFIGCGGAMGMFSNSDNKEV